MINKKTILANKKVVICDYPSRYLFPPEGYGGIERWLWTVANESAKLGMKVFLLGPQWQADLLPIAKHFNESIINITVDDFLKKIGHVDFLVGGHEYWLNDSLIKKFNLISDYSLTFQHASYPAYKANTFDDKRNFLFCYSDQMCKMFKQQKPTKLLCVSYGYNEKPEQRHAKDYLITIGRIDEDKAQHYAILAAKILGLKIYIMGNNVKNDEYEKKYKNLFNLPHVKKVGVLSGKEKMKMISEAMCGVYTAGKNYIEPAAGTIAEIIRSGIPLAGISWSGEDAVCEPIKINSRLGEIAYCDKKNDSDDVIAEKLASAIKKCLELDRNLIFKSGNEIYDPARLVTEMYGHALNQR